ncbi:MAG TPA: aromatase/cyclase [Kineosporiaceae bacterium]
MTGTRTRHLREVAAPAQVLFGLVADVTWWPVIFEPTVHVDVLERTPDGERFRLWATVGGAVRTWTSRRRLDREALTITFEQERTQAPIAQMSGAWHFHPRPGGATVVLDHDFAAVDDAAAEDLAGAVDANSERELAALARVAELGHPVEDLVFAFEDEVRLRGPAPAAYDFVHRADLWPDRLPHVARVELSEDDERVQDLLMDTVTRDGGSHRTRSVRLCLPPDRIVYKQLRTPEVLIGHSGSWTFRQDGEDAVIVARHLVALDPAKITQALGEGHDVASARRHVREALGENSRTTMSHAALHAIRRLASATE